MRSHYRFLALIALLSLPSARLMAQEDIEKFLTESVEDGKKLIGAYVDPVMKSTSLAMNQGWYNTAKPHKIAGIDLTITVNAMTVPDQDVLFRPDQLGLQKIQLATTSSQYPYVSTLLGPDKSSTFQAKDPSVNATYSIPGGIGVEDKIGSNKVPVPMVHLGFGLPKNTDIKLRFLPTIDLKNSGTVKMIGIGVMHDIKQWIPGIKLMPFDLSGFVGFTKFDVEYKLDPDNAQHADQRGLFNITSTTVQALISKKFSVITFYGGLGYNIAKSNLAMKGNYSINGTNYKDPVDLNFAASGPRATIGTRLKLAVFTFHADYTVQKYKCLTVGFGIAVR